VLVSDIIEYAAVNFGGRPAIISEAGTVSFRELRDRARQLAHALTGIAATGDRVAILSQNRPEYVEAYLGVPMAGMCLTLLNYRLATRELARITADAEPSVLLVEAEYLDRVEEIQRLAPSVRTIVVLGGSAHPVGGDVVSYDDLVDGASTAPVEVAVDEHDLAILIYTSGTTGMPKGAMLTHRNVIAAMSCWLIHSARPTGTGVSLMPFPMCHIAGIGVIANFNLGTTTVLQRSYEPEAFMAAIDEFQVTGSSFAPTMLSMLLNHPRIDEFDLGSLTTIAYGGASMPVELLKATMARFPNAEFIQGYGMTELAGSILCLDAAAHRVAAAGRTDILATSGRPGALVAVRLVDDDMQDVALGEIGEIVVRGDNVMSGYWRRPDDTAAAFAGGWFHTGDLGRALHEGYIAIVDRKKDMIITGGENVYSREVEEIIYLHPNVAEVAVIGLPDPDWGERVCAVIVARPGTDVADDDVISICRENLAGYKKPTHIAHVTELPHNAAGKVVKPLLRETIIATLTLPTET
jgi:acyl-CoA synthetase (AMP-forming)/AMP-acid ligase II